VTGQGDAVADDVTHHGEGVTMQKLGKTTMMARVGAKLTNVRWGWDGVMADGSIVFIGWADHVVRSTSGGIESCQIFKHNAAHNAGPGGRERGRHIAELIKDKAVGYLVLATSKNAAVDPREIADVDPSLHSVRLEERGDEVFAIPVGENSAPEAGLATDANADVAHVVASQIPETEKAQLVLARRGQGLFRARVEMIEARCRLTGVADRAHLRASHIKPWRHSTNAERLDGSNGLLLAPHVDHLFDRGFLTFDADGTIVISPKLTAEVVQAWHLDMSKAVAPFSKEQAAYLVHHRTHCFMSA
jgi:hypothetical protein